MRRILFLILITVGIPLFAQRVQTVSGTYVYVVPENQSYADAKITALKQAQIQILADTYGTVIELTAATSISGEGATTRALSESNVKGEWIETVGEPVFTRLVKGDNIAIRVEVKGKVREITTAVLQFDAKSLCNAPDVRFEKTDFKSGDDLYLYFSTSSNGWLAVYLYDGNEDVYCLLPYSGQSDGIYQVKGGRKYIFFSEDIADEYVSTRDIDEYTLTCTGEKEVNRLYVICSPNKFTKAVDNKGNDAVPRMLNYLDFQSWLSSIRMADKELGVKTIDITIRK